MNDRRSTTDQLRDAVHILNRRGLYDAADFCKREVERVDARLKEIESKKVPCPDGFRWIGQALWTCDGCGLPAWEHAGISELAKGAGPFGDEPFVLRPWREGEAEAVRAKWEPDMLARNS